MPESDYSNTISVTTLGGGSSGGSAGGYPRGPVITRYPNNDAKHKYPKLSHSEMHEEGENFEHIDDKPDLGGMRLRVAAAQDDASWYYDRNRTAYDYWHSRWAGQSIDGRKWPDARSDSSDRIWPWPGASDTRVRTVEMIGNEHLTIDMYALMNMKVQARSTHPAATVRQSQQATKLLNWVLFVQMQEELYRELPLWRNWRNMLGAAALEINWQQETRLWLQPINLINLQALAGDRGFEAQQTLDQFINVLFDPAGQEQAMQIVMSASPLVDKKKARQILKDLREMRTAEIPVPEIVKSRPRWTALRPMVDLLFPARVDDLQRSPWVDRIEYVTETELMDRKELHGYDEDFIDEVLDSGGMDATAPRGVAQSVNSSIYSQSDDDDKQYELHHFYHRGLVDGQPAIYCTVMHLECEHHGKHEPMGYAHGLYPFSIGRREYHERPILSSRGICEIAYTWENEIKKQRDMRSDRTDLALKPPLFTDYDALLKMKVQFMPETVIPVHRNGEAEWFKAPPWDPGSIEIEKSLMETIERFFFGNPADPKMRMTREQELADTCLMELQPAIAQTGALIDEFIPMEQVVAVLGEKSQWQRPERKAIMGRFHYTATIDMRNRDPEFLQQKLQYFSQLAAMDPMGLIDQAELLTIGAETIDYELAERLVRDPQPATQNEVEKEQETCDLILGSGQDQKLPMGANYQLRLQTLMERVQGYQQNPISQRKLQETPELLKVFETRANFFQRQMQQMENSKIGKQQVTQSFSKSAIGTASAPQA